ncbi:MAG: Tetratricopeptide repeat protein [Methanobacterium sp. PtaU1.Bin242]|nr:MAG: Tetratricopeptide repeat protein [Methanobacterium sp. PtaU1.Bin242]
MEQHEANEFLEQADIFYDQKNYDGALDYYKKAMIYIKDSKNKSEEADLFLKLGNLYSDMKDFDKAEDYYKKSLNIYSAQKDLIGQGYSRTGLGIIHEKYGDHDEARGHYNKALKYFRKAKDDEREGIVISLIASTYESQGAWEDALIEYKRSFQKFEKLQNHGRTDKYTDITQRVQEKRSQYKISHQEIALALIYLLGLIVAEVMVANYNLQVGLALDAIILFALLVNSSIHSSYNFSILLRSMMALPIIRIIGLSIPLMQIQPLYWFPIISIPLFAASFTIMRAQRLSRKNVGLIWGNLPVQLLIALTGVFLGTLEYLILQPKPLIATYNLENLLFASVILIISTGLAEEILFRGIIQKNAENVLGAFYGLLYTAFLFTALHIGWNSIYDLIFVFAVAMFYGYVFQKTKSIFGITLSHGISNTFLFLIIPFYASWIYSLIPWL